MGASFWQLKPKVKWILYPRRALLLSPKRESLILFTMVRCCRLLLIFKTQLSISVQNYYYFLFFLRGGGGSSLHFPSWKAAILLLCCGIWAVPLWHKMVSCYLVRNFQDLVLSMQEINEIIHLPHVHSLHVAGYGYQMTHTLYLQQWCHLLSCCTSTKGGRGKTKHK